MKVVPDKPLEEMAGTVRRARMTEEIGASSCHEWFKFTAAEFGSLIVSCPCSCSSPVRDHAAAVVL
jgi:hypothetical protein